MVIFHEAETRIRSFEIRKSNTVIAVISINDSRKINLKFPYRNDGVGSKSLLLAFSGESRLHGFKWVDGAKPQITTQFQSVRAFSLVRLPGPGVCNHPRAPSSFSPIVGEETDMHTVASFMDPAFREEFKEADVVIARPVNELTQGTCFFGLDKLLEVASGKRSARIDTVVEVVIDYATDELEYLAACCEVLKGSCCYDEHVQYKKKRSKDDPAFDPMTIIQHKNRIRKFL